MPGILYHSEKLTWSCSDDDNMVPGGGNSGREVAMGAANFPKMVSGYIIGTITYQSWPDADASLGDVTLVTGIPALPIED